MNISKANHFPSSAVMPCVSFSDSVQCADNLALGVLGRLADASLAIHFAKMAATFPFAQAQHWNER